MGNVNEKIIDIRLLDKFYGNNKEIQDPSPSHQHRGHHHRHHHHHHHHHTHGEQPKTDLSGKVIIWVLGGPGSGKGTQCEKIVDKYGFQHLSTGDLLRAEVKSGSHLGKKVEDIMKKGELVSNDVVLDLLKGAIEKQAPISKGFIIDGYPREIKQGSAFEKNVGNVTAILNFEVSDDTLVARCMGRSAAGSGRSDDNEQSVKHRVKVFKDQHKSILKEYSHKTVTIDAERPIDAVFNDVVKYLDSIVQNKAQGTVCLNQKQDMKCN